jgi:hypothetical protein
MQPKIVPVKVALSPFKNVTSAAPLKNVTKANTTVNATVVQKKNETKNVPKNSTVLVQKISNVSSNTSVISQKLAFAKKNVTEKSALPKIAKPELKT